MKLYKAICLIAFMFSGISLFSQNQTITLKDGTVFEGYISKQDYTNGQGEIYYSRMTKTFLSEDVQGMRTEKREFERLSKEWQNWAIENNKVETIGNNRYVSLTNMTVKGQSSRDYYILVTGAKYLTAFTISDGIEPCKMSEIASIRKPERANTLLIDIDDIVQTDNATYTGVILEQIPGVSFTVWNKSDHSVHRVDYADVRSVGKSRFNKDYSIWDQTPYLERVNLKNGTTGIGLVIENSFEDDITILFAEKNGDGMDSRQYKYSDIISITRYRNPDYTPIYDIVLREGESRINRDSTLFTIETIQLMSKDSGKFFVIDPAKMEHVAKVKRENVVIETNTLDASGIYIAKALLLKHIPMSQILPKDNKGVQPAEKKSIFSKKKKEPEKTVNLYGYTYTTLFESDIEAKSVTSINGTTKISFTLPEPGIYFVYLRKDGTCWAVDYRPDGHNLENAFDDIAKLKGFMLYDSSPEDYNYPKEIGTMRVTVHGNANPRKEFLSILSKIPSELIIAENIDRSDVDRWYMEDLKNGETMMMHIFVGTGSADTVAELFTGSSRSSYHKIAKRIAEEYYKQ